LAFCDYSGIAYKIDVAASHARVVHLPTQYASFLFISIHSCGGVFSRHLPGKSSRGLLCEEMSHKWTALLYCSSLGG